MTRTSALIASAFLLATFTPAQAGLVLTIGNMNLRPGQTGTLDVTATSEGLPVRLDTFGFEFKITTLSGPDRLEFTTSQTDPYTNAKPAYVFANDRLSQGVALGNVSSTGGVPNNTYIGGDSTLSGNDVALGNPSLIAHLTVTTVTGLPPMVGDRFLISLVAGANSYFEDKSVTVLDRSVSGMVSVNSTVAVVPEPATVVTLSTGLIVLLVWKLKEKSRT